MSNKINKRVKEEILGKDWLAGKPGSKISQFVTQSSNHAFVPGAVDHWNQDIQERVTAIKKWNRKGLLTVTQKMPDTMSGKSVLDICMIPPVAKLVKSLKHNPTNLEARLLLVSVTLNQHLDLPVEFYRELYLQAAVAQQFESAHERS